MELSTSVSGTKLGYIVSPKTNYLHFPWIGKQSARVTRKSPSISMVSNGYAGTATTGYRDSYNYNTISNKRIYKRLDSCLVVPPPKGQKPRAIIKFLGGAFIGAVPEVTYSYFVELLAKEGFLVISVPYNVTFDHAQATKQVYERFNASLDIILTSGLPDADLKPADLLHLPIFSVGHSNGALLQVLTGSYFSDKIPKIIKFLQKKKIDSNLWSDKEYYLWKANAIISFNNRPATEAVPYFEQLGPLVSQIIPLVEASPVYSMAMSASGNAWKALLDTAGAMMANNDEETLLSLTKFVDQLPSVLNQVTEGISEFKPTPSENRDCFKSSYNVQHTLLVKFSFDTIDETDLLEEALKPRVDSMGGMVEKVLLAGTHITPCIQEPKWQVGYVYTPADAIAQRLKAFSLNDTRVLSKTISNWFRRFEG
ncbi:DUF1350 domain-containing protein [Cephalotus follicularis]|uniref:DUF1350 domain-containing protein n=1 Tax=Cephalotus follicularis TaxID=3775 RepID=A0A1Q3C1T9_CEPFO|nr:DUF1350 domain-containing protein [Cephalotus follicularis]